jgi:dipeptidyl-peptidase-4
VIAAAAGIVELETVASTLPIARIHAAPALDGPAIGRMAWSPDGMILAFLRAPAEHPGCYDLWLCEAAGDAAPRQLLNGAAADARAAPSPAETARRERQRQFGGGIGDFAWSACGGFIITRLGDAVCRVSTATGAVEPVLPGAASDVQPAPKGGRLAFILDGAVWVGSGVGGSNIRRVSPAASDTVRYGIAEFVAQEEFARDTGNWWRPDGGALAYTRVDESGVTEVVHPMIGAQGVEVARQRFPKVGTANAQVDLFVTSLGPGAQPVRIALGDDADTYLLRVHWSYDGRSLFIQRQSRDQRRIDLFTADPVTGEARVIWREEAAPWVNPNLDFMPLADGGFLWVSERSGTAQLYRHTDDGSIIAQLTDAPFPLAARDRERAIAGVDEAGGAVFVIGGDAGGVTERHLYRVPLDGSGAMARVSQESGWWGALLAPGGKVLAATHSSPAQPPRAALYQADGGLLCSLEANRLDACHPYMLYADGLPHPEFGQLVADDGQRLDYVLLRPANFDPLRRYPAILHVYGGPGRQLVRKAWRAPEERAFLDAGYVMLQLDNRGACGRGLAFEAPIAGRLGQPEVEDQLLALAHLRGLPFVNPARIGAMGWSYGGFMTLRLMSDPRARLRAGIAGGSVATWWDYDTHYTERFLGDPAHQAEAYQAASVIPGLAQLEGRLMLVHGMADDNVHLTHATALMAELQRLGTPFDLMLYPGQGHVITGDARTHMLQTYRAFFDRELAAHD